MPPTAPINDSFQTAHYRDYHNDNTYVYNPGRLVIPCANGAPVVVQVHRAFSVRTQSWSAVKEVTPPVLPAPEDETASDANGTLIAQTVVVPMAQPLPGGSANRYRFAAAGTYQYIESKPTTPTTGYPSGRAPYYGANPDAFGGVIGGVGTLPFILNVPFETGIYDWPFTAIGPQFFDPFLSVALRASGSYQVNTIGQG